MSSRKRFSKLLRNPKAVRMSGQIEVHNASAIMRDHKKAIQNIEYEGWDGEEIHCCNPFTMIA
jgi:hypothetical protein